jgi:putative transposase
LDKKHGRARDTSQKLKIHRFDRAMKAAAHEVTQHLQQRVVTDGHTSYPRAIEEELGEHVEHEISDCRRNPIEQSHQWIKQRYYPTLEFGAFESAQRFCQAYDEVVNFLKLQCYTIEAVLLSERREQFIERVSELEVIFQAAQQRR